jgi:membrane protease YdiL (CAAX protease family)
MTAHLSEPELPARKAAETLEHARDSRWPPSWAHLDKTFGRLRLVQRTGSSAELLAQRSQPAPRTALLAILCVCAGTATLAARWIADDALKIGFGLFLAVAFLALTLLARRVSSLRRSGDLLFAFFVLAVVQVLNNSIPGFVGTDLLHDPPNAGNPLASTVSGTVVVQLVGAALAIAPVLVLTRVSGSDLGSVYVRKGAMGGWLVLAVIVFVACSVFVATLPLRPGSPVQRLLPTNGLITFDRFLALTPALLVMVLSNGFEEEVLFRGLFLQKYDAVFDPRVANVLQAAVFSIAHAGVTYTPSALVFIVLLVFPIGLAAGYLMRASSGVLVPAVFHAGLDLAIYLPFLSYAT